MKRRVRIAAALAASLGIGLFALEAQAGTVIRSQLSHQQLSSQAHLIPVAWEANTYPVGQCTWGVKQLAPWIPNALGDAKHWLAAAQQLGFASGQEPRVGAIIVWGGGDYGHVGLVTSVVAGDWIRILEANVDGIKEIRDFRGYFNPYQTLSGPVLGYIYPPDGIALDYILP